MPIKNYLRGNNIKHSSCHITGMSWSVPATDHLQVFKCCSLPIYKNKRSQLIKSSLSHRPYSLLHGLFNHLMPWAQVLMWLNPTVSFSDFLVSTQANLSPCSSQRPLSSFHSLQTSSVLHRSGRGAGGIGTCVKQSSVRQCYVRKKKNKRREKGK